MQPLRIFSAPPRTKVAVYALKSTQIHDYSTQHLEPLGRKRLGEEIRIVVFCADKRHHDLLRFDHIAYEEVSSCDVL